MQKLAELCIRRPIFATMIIMALVVVGTASYFHMGLDRFPDVDLPTVSVRTTLPGASSEEMESLVSDVIEEAVNTVEGIEEIRSINSNGNSIVIVTLSLSRNIDVAAQDVRDRVATILKQLPEDTDPPIIAKFNNENTPVLTFAVSGDRTIRELTELADKVIKPQLERSMGVGELRIVGGLERAISVWADAERLEAYNLSITDVLNAIRKQNTDIPGGNVTNSVREESIRTIGRFENPRDFNDLVIRTVNGAPIRVEDIGYAEDGTKEQRSISRLNGKPTVVIGILKQSGANTVATIDAVKENMERLKAQLPADIHMEVIQDQSRFIEAALHEINIHLVLGSIFACLVVLAFMRSWRSTIIAGIAIPTSLISTFGMMKALNFTLNSVTMLALVLMVGIVIDDAIVVLENIFRFVEEKKMNAKDAAREATADIGLAVLATTLSLVVIFVPVSFMSSVSGRFLYQFGITAAVAIMVSLLVSFSLTPMMSARLLRREDAGGHQGHSREGFYGYIDRAYVAMLHFVMRHRLVVSALAVAVILSAIPLYTIVRQEFLPSDVDEDEFQVSLTAPETASVTAMSQAVQKVEKDLRALPAVRTVLSEVGGSFMARVNTAQLTVRIVPIEQRVFSIGRFFRGLIHLDPGEAFRNNYSQRDVMMQVRRVIRNYPDLRGQVRNFPSFNMGGGSFDIDFVIRGPELDKLAAYAEELRVRAGKLGGILDADTTLKLDRPELRVEIDRKRAADLGVEVADIAQALRSMVGGDLRVTRFRDPSVNEDYDVQLRLTEQYRDNPDVISRLYVPRSGGGLVRLDNLVKIVPSTIPSRIDRLDRQRQSSVRAGVGPGYGLADRLDALREAAMEMNMPPAYTTSVAGRGRELERTGREFLIAFGLSVIFMYMVLASQFDSLIHPFTILLSLPLSVPFALFSLWATGNSLNLYSALGMLVLFGVVKKNSILQIDHMNSLRRKGLERYAAIIQGNRDRLRPILMTTLALVAGMMPLALGTGPGSEERRAIAVVVIGGQSLSLLLTLLVTPVAYSLFDDITETALWKRWFGERKSDLDLDVVPEAIGATAALREQTGD
ncbi:MAG: efflux RND transporter permease subunit [Bryobacterales bacterium]|nr:efflux RND transporter permease subunit [Bryobacterales bacterium]